LAVAESLESAVETALIVHVPAAVGAVNSPLELMLPQEVDQVTDLFAENCAWPIACTGTVEGVIVTPPVFEVMVTVVEAVFPLLSVAVAVTLQEPDDAGAVYSPPPVIVPQAAAHVAPAFAVN